MGISVLEKKAQGCGLAVSLPLSSAYTLQQLTVFSTAQLGFFPQSFWVDVAEFDV